MWWPIGRLGVLTDKGYHPSETGERAVMKLPIHREYEESGNYYCRLYFFKFKIRVILIFKIA
jgi:hypothetical protein